MALPTLVKTWQHSINQTVAAQGSVVATEKRLIRTIKNLLIGFATNPWTVRGSGNATTGAMDAVDRWTADSDITKAAGGSPHSWIVLRQTGIAANFEVCLDMNISSQGLMSVIVSPSAGFTGGSNTARPTATDEIVLISAATWFSAVDTQHQIHAQQSTDGQCTRLQVWRGSTNQCTFWLFDKPQNTPTGWTNPSISLAVGATTSLAMTYGTLITAITKGRGSATFSLFWTAEGASSTLLANLADVGSVANDFDANWPVFPIGIASTQLSHKGRHGTITDLWWSPNGIASADTLPNNAGTRDFAVLGNLIFPWTGDATTPLLT